MMWSVFLKFLCILIICKVSYQLKVLKIGAIFFQDEFSLMEALDIAILDINRLDEGVQLLAIKHFLSEDDSIILQELTYDLFRQGVIALVGPSSKSSSDIVAILCNITGIPHLQFDWNKQITEANFYRYHFTVNVAPSEHTLSTALFDILKSSEFDWKSFTIVYENHSDLTSIMQLLSWKGLHKTSIKLLKFYRHNDYRILWKKLLNSKEKFIVLMCPHDILFNIMSVAIYFNMTGPFNNLFLVNLDTHLSGLNSLYSQKFSAKVIAIRLRPYIRPYQLDEYDVFKKADNESIRFLNCQCLYDVVLLFYHGLKSTKQYNKILSYTKQENLEFWPFGKDIIKAMKEFKLENTAYPFKTQKLHINRFGLRDDFNLEIYNPLMNRITHIWNKYHGLIAYEKLLKNITKKEEEFSSESREDFSQRRVRYIIATRIGEPYFMWRVEPEGVHYEGNERFEGYAVDLIYKLAEECKFDFSFEPVLDNSYGSFDPVTEEWNGIIRELIDNNAHLGICDLTITQARRSVVDFTVPFMQLGVSILFHKPKPIEKSLLAFLKPFSLDVWLYLLVALFLVAFLMVLMVRLNLSEWNVNQQMTNYVVILENKWFFGTSLWLYLSSILQIGGSLLPRTGPTRLLTALWWIFALLLYQTYIAKLASFITASKLESVIKNLHDLVQQNKVQFGTVKGGATSLLFSESNETDYRLAWNKMIAMKPEAFTSNTKEGVDRVKRSKGKYAFLLETPNLQYFIQKNCELTQIGEPFGEKHYGIAVPLNAPYRSNLSVGILKLSEKGVLYNLKNKWFNSNESNCNIMNIQETAQSSQFNMDAMKGLFLVLIGGILFAFIIGICEFLWNVQKVAIKQKITNSQALKEELTFFLKFELRRKPLKVTKKNNKLTLEMRCTQNASKED